MQLRSTALATMMLLAATSCAVAPASTDLKSLDDTAWILAELPGVQPVPGTVPTLRFADARATGTDGCNRFSGGYTVTGSALEIDTRVASTQMACPPEVMRLADAFMTALLGARSFRIAGDRLQLLSADGTVRATLAAQSQELAGTAWQATGINNGKGGVVSLVAGSTVTLEFAADGKASGSAGCNRFTTSYQADGPRLSFSNTAATRRACGAAGLMEQEQAFLKALESVATTRIEGERLELRNAQGSLLASLVRG